MRRGVGRTLVTVLGVFDLFWRRLVRKDRERKNCASLLCSYETVAARVPSHESMADRRIGPEGTYHIISRQRVKSWAAAAV